MRVERNNQDWIEDYLDGLLTSEEQSDFENRLKSDPILSDELRLTQKLRGQIANEGTLRDKLINIESELEKNKYFESKANNVKKINTPLLLGIAATLLLLVGAFFMLGGPTETHRINVDEVLAQSSEVWNKSLPNEKALYESLGFADKNTAFKDSMTMALKLIEEGEYKEARLVLSKILSSYPDNEKAQYYYGYNQLSLGNYGEAVGAFAKLVKSPNDEIRYDAQFYYAIGLMKTDGEKKAVEELKKIAADEKSPHKYIARDYIGMLE